MINYFGKVLAHFVTDFCISSNTEEFVGYIIINKIQNMSYKFNVINIVRCSVAIVSVVQSVCSRIVLYKF